MTHEILAEGLVNFYSSQAQLVLAQYENINQLLGPTTDWTHPGTHCEVLLRDFLRRHLLQGMSVDKGYIYGLVERDGRPRHGPEIDILIHNTKDFRPVFRLEDFVIIQPEAVLGMIQVKRTFRSGKEGALANGLRQIVNARQHILDITVQQKIRQMAAIHGDDSSKAKTYPELKDTWPKRFAALVSFEDETDKAAETYRTHLLDVYRENRSCTDPRSEHDLSVQVLPDFVGSLKGVSLISHKGDINYRVYDAYDSISGENNVGLQLFLWCLTDRIFDLGVMRPPFAFPKSLCPISVVPVPHPTESLHGSPKAP